VIDLAALARWGAVPTRTSERIIYVMNKQSNIPFRDIQKLVEYFRGAHCEECTLDAKDGSEDHIWQSVAAVEWWLAEVQSKKATA
jgi:hypothetical protein